MTISWQHVQSGLCILVISWAEALADSLPSRQLLLSSRLATMCQLVLDLVAVDSHCGDTAAKFVGVVQGRTLWGVATQTAVGLRTPGPTHPPPSPTSTSLSCSTPSGMLSCPSHACYRCPTQYSVSISGDAWLVPLAKLGGCAVTLSLQVCLIFFGPSGILSCVHHSNAGVAFCRKKRKWNGPPQYENPTGELMMLETDLVSC